MTPIDLLAVTLTKTYAALELPIDPPEPDDDEAEWEAEIAKADDADEELYRERTR